VTGSNGGIYSWERPGFTRISGKWVHGLKQLAKCFLCGFCWMSATKEPVQLYNFVSKLYSPFWSVTACPPSTPPPTPLWALMILPPLVQQLRILILYGGKRHMNVTALLFNLDIKSLLFIVTPSYWQKFLITHDITAKFPARMAGTNTSSWISIQTYTRA